MMESGEKKLLNEEEKFELRMRMTHEERFRMLMKLIRINKMLQQMTIVHAQPKS